MPQGRGDEPSEGTCRARRQLGRNGQSPRGNPCKLFGGEERPGARNRRCAGSTGGFEETHANYLVAKKDLEQGIAGVQGALEVLRKPMQIIWWRRKTWSKESQVCREHWRF